MTGLHCDRCDKYLGEYLYGPGGVEERAVVGTTHGIGLPDVVCFDCMGRTTSSLPRDERVVEPTLEDKE